MIHLVLDASTAIDWFVLTPEGEGYSRHLTTLAAAGQVRFSVPLHFDVEVTGYLVKKHRQRPAEFTQKWLDEALTTLDAGQHQLIRHCRCSGARSAGARPRSGTVALSGWQRRLHSVSRKDWHAWPPMHLLRPGGHLLVTPL